MTSLDLIFQYRTLLGKCESGAGLDLDEIDTVIAIEASFAPGEDDFRARDGRRFRRERVDLVAVIKGGSLNDKVQITELSPGGLVVSTAPYADEGQVLEVVIDDAELSLSYRFKARVQWLREDHGDDFQLGLALIGTPVLVHYGTDRPAEDSIKRIAA